MVEPFIELPLSECRSCGCKLYGRLNVQVEGQNDELGSFIFRSTGYNSVRTPVYDVDLTLREGQTIADAVQQAKEAAMQDQEAGIDTVQLKAAARQLFANGQFEDNEEEIPQVLEEFYPEADTDTPSDQPVSQRQGLSLPSFILQSGYCSKVHFALHTVSAGQHLKG
jgi:hypothetical protein